MTASTLPASLRPMPDYDEDWFQRLETAQATRLALLAKPGALSEAERDELAAAHREMEAAHNAQFETVAAYRDHKLAWAAQLLDDEGIHMDLPDLGEDCTVDDVDRVLMMVANAIDVTNGETF